MAIEVNEGGVPLKLEAHLDTKKLEKAYQDMFRRLNDVQKAEMQKTLKDTFTNMAATTPELAPVRDVRKHEIAAEQKKLAESLKEASAAFAQLEASSQSSWSELARMRAQVQDLAAAKRELARQLKTGAISAEEYTRQLAAIEQQQFQTSNALKKLSADVTNHAKAEKAAVGSIEEARLKLSALGREIIATGGAMDGSNTKVNAMIDQYNELNNSLKAIEERMGNHQRSVGHYAKGWNGLQNSINQLSREMPAFVVSAQTGFLALSNNIPILADEISRVRTENARLVAEGKKGVPVWKQIAGALLSWQTAMSLGITLVTLYGKEIGEWIGTLFRGKKAVDELKESQKALNEARLKGAQSAQTELTSLRSLYTAARNTNLSLLTRKKAVEELRKQFPQYFKNLTDETIMVGKATAAYTRLTGAIMANAHAKAYHDKINENTSKQLENTEKILDAQSRLVKAEKELKEAREATADTYVDVSFGGAVRPGENRLDLARAARNDIAKEINTIEQENKRLESQNSRFASNIQELVQKHGLSALTGDYSETSVKEVSDKVLNARQSLLDKIADLDAEYARKAMMSDDEEVQALRDKFTKIRREVERFNADPENKTAIIDVKVLGALQDKAEKNLTYEQESKRLHKQLDDQLDLWQRYQDARAEIGNEAARRMFEHEKGFTEDFRRLLTDQTAALQGKEATNGLNDVEKERLHKIQADLDAFDKNQRDQRNAAYAEAYQAAMTFEQKKLLLTTQYAKMAAEINDPDNPELKRQRDEAIQAAENEAMQRTEIFRKLNEDVIGYTKQQLSDQIGLLNKSLENELITPESKARIQAKLKELTETLNATPEDGGFWDKLIGEGFSAHEAALKRRIELINEAALKEGISAEEVAKQADELVKIKQELKQIAAQKFNALASALSDVSGAFAELASSLPDTASGLKDTLQSMSDLTKVASDAAGSVASFMSGDIIGGISKGIRAITGVVNFFKQAKESARQAQKEIEAYYASLKSGEMEHARMLRERAREQENINDLTREELEIRQRMLDEQTSANKRDYDYWLRKIQQEGIQVVGQRTEKYGGFLGIGKKTRVVDVTAGLRSATYDDIERLAVQGKLNEETAKWWEELKKVYSETEAINDMLKEIEETEIRKMTGGLTSQSLADTIINGIKQGKKGIADFADDFEDSIANALLSAMSYTLLEDDAKKLIKQFQDDAMSGDGLDSWEVQRFKEGVQSLAQVGVDAAKAIEQALGTTFGKDQNTKLTGRLIEGLTEQTAGKLEGLWRAVYELDVKRFGLESQQLALMNSKLTALNQIRDNTGRTADNTDRLAAIEAGITQITINTRSGSGKTLEGMGL